MANVTNEEFYSGSAFTLSITARFWLYLIPEVLSLSCSLIVLFHLLFSPSLRQALNNHVFIVLLFIGLVFELFDIPFTLHYYRLRTDWHLSKSFSLFWTYIDFTSYTSQVIVFAWATIERHILIFHHQCVSSRRGRFLFHYLPLIVLLIYVLLYCLIIIYFPPCENLYFHSYINGVPVPCAIDKTLIGKYDLICHQIIPTFIIVISSVMLFIRVLYQKTRLNRPISWRKQRKMAVQLLSVSILYILLNFPWTFIDLCFELGLQMNNFYQIRSYAYFFSCYIIFLFPFVCLGSFPDLRKKVKSILCCNRDVEIIIHQRFEMKCMIAEQFNRNKP